MTNKQTGDYYLTKLMNIDCLQNSPLQDYSAVVEATSKTLAHGPDLTVEEMVVLMACPFGYENGSFSSPIIQAICTLHIGKKN